MTEDVGDLVQTLERIREEKYPELPEGLVKEIVEVEASTLEERSEAPGRVDDIVDSYLEKEG